MKRREWSKRTYRRVSPRFVLVKPISVGIDEVAEEAFRCRDQVEPQGRKTVERIDLEFNSIACLQVPRDGCGAAGATG